MNDLTSGSFAYAFDDLVEVTVAAYNSFGDGPASNVNTIGARIRTAPTIMSDPFKGAGTTDT